MANIFGYNQVFTPNAETWFVDGYVEVGSNGYTVTTSPLPREIASLSHDATGTYTLKLAHCWNSLLFVDIKTELGLGPPAILFTQIVSSNVGAAGTVDGEQGVTFKLINTSGTAADLAPYSGFRVLMLLKRSSA